MSTEFIPFIEASPAAIEFHFANLLEKDRQHLFGPRDWPSPCAWCGGRIHHSEACDELRDSWVPRLGFGKHKGKRIDEADPEYLRWAWDNGTLRNADLKEAVLKLLGIKETPEESHEVEVAAAVW